MSRSFSIIPSFIAGSAACAVLAGAAFAAMPTKAAAAVPVSITVDVTDTTTPQDAERTLQVIREKAFDACRRAYNQPRLSQYDANKIRECRDDLVARAVEHANRPFLSAAFHGDDAARYAASSGQQSN